MPSDDEARSNESLDVERSQGVLLKTTCISSSSGHNASTAQAARRTHDVTGLDQTMPNPLAQKQDHESDSPALKQVKARRVTRVLRFGC